MSRYFIHNWLFDFDAMMVYREDEDRTYHIRYNEAVHRWEYCIGQYFIKCQSESITYWSGFAHHTNLRIKEAHEEELEQVILGKEE